MNIRDLSKLDFHVWMAGFVNIVGYAHLTYTVLVVQNHESISILQCMCVAYIQIIYMLLGYKTKNKGLFWCMLVALVLNIFIVGYVGLIRWYS